MKNSFLLLIFFAYGLLLFGQQDFKVIYEADRNGNVVSGSIDSLKIAIRTGKPVRVGWTLEIRNSDGESKKLEHWTDSKFLTILDDNVYAQIHSIYEQMTSFQDNEGAMKFVDNQADGWVALISTSGIMRQKYADILKGTEGMSEEEIKTMVKAMETSRVHTMWAVPK